MPVARRPSRSPARVLVGLASLLSSGCGAPPSRPAMTELAVALAHDYAATVPPDHQPWDWSSFVFQYAVQVMVDSPTRAPWCGSGVRPSAAV